MGSILDVGKKQPHRKKHYQSKRKHYVSPVSMLSNRRRFVRSKPQAFIYLFIIFLIIIVAISTHEWAAAIGISLIVFITAVLYFGYHWLVSLFKKL